MAAIKLLECDGCEKVTFKKDESHFGVRGVNKTDAKVAKLDLCNDCAGELFGDRIKELKARKEKAAAAPAKTAPAKTAQAKAS